jgi:molybdate transport system ATP-binding protein
MSDAGLSLRLCQREPIRLDVELDCERGSLLAVVGPSGSGKTTLLRCIAGLHRAAEGEIRSAGETWFCSRQGIDLRPQRRPVGLVFQDYALFPHLSARANVAAAMSHRPRAQRTAAADRLLELVNLHGLESRRPASLSGGQRQRVALARALAREPSVLLLDEPFSAVDQVTRRKLQRELVLLRSELRMPVLLVTHDLDEAMALADRILLLHRGRSLQCADPQTMMLRPRSPEVARLMGQQNLFTARIARRDPERGTLWLDWHGMALEAPAHERFRPGEDVAWMIPASHVLLHRRGRPSRGERENPVTGVVESLAELGEYTSVVLAVAGGAARVHFTIGSHAARRNGLAAGVRATVSLLSDGLHLMPMEAR